MKITTVGDPGLRERTLPISREELRSPVINYFDRNGSVGEEPWEQFERHGMSAFLERIAPYT